MIYDAINSAMEWIVEKGEFASFGVLLGVLFFGLIVEGVLFG